MPGFLGCKGRLYRVVRLFQWPPSWPKGVDFMELSLKIVGVQMSCQRLGSRMCRQHKIGSGCTQRFPSPSSTRIDHARLFKQDSGTFSGHFEDLRGYPPGGRHVSRSGRRRLMSLTFVRRIVHWIIRRGLFA